MKVLPIIHRYVLTSMLPLLSVLTASAELRTFTNQKGVKIKAEITAVAGEKVTLRLANGKEYTIPVTSLSLGDQIVVKAWDPKKEKAGTGKSGKSTLVIPENVNYKFEFEADKKRLAKGSKGRVDSGELKTDKWGYEISLENKSRADLEGLEMSYRIYVDPKASAKIGFDSPPKFYGARMKVASVANGASVIVTTGPVPLTELELDSDYVFKDGSRNDLEDKLEGIWIKIWHGDKKVAEFKSNKSTVKKAKWEDNETADPNAEPEEDKPAVQEADPKE